MVLKFSLHYRLNRSCLLLALAILTFFLMITYLLTGISNNKIEVEEIPAIGDVIEVWNSSSLAYLSDIRYYLYCVFVWFLKFYWLNCFRKQTGCFDKSTEMSFERRGNYWILKNYIVANKVFQCHESVTYTTHVDFTFLDNLEPLLLRWMAPISVAVYSPGTDFQKSLESILYLRNCLNDSKLIRDYVTFHFFFDRDFTPEDVSAPL